jgi:hypothetical protein
MRPTGRRLVLLALAATALVAAVTRFPTNYGGQWSFGLRYLIEPRRPWRELAWHEVVYLGGLLAWAVVAVGWFGGVVMRRALAWWYGVPRRRSRAAWGRHAVLCALLAGTVCIVGVGWPFRVGMWAVAREARTVTPAGQQVPAFELPRGYEAEQVERGLESALRFGPTARERLLALRLLAERYPGEASAVIERAIGRESDPAVLAWELRVNSVYRIPSALSAEWAERLTPYLDHASADVRAAAADGIAVLYDDVTRGQLPRLTDLIDGGLPTTRSDPPIGISRPKVKKERQFFGGPQLPALRERLITMMTAGPTPAERDAAAAALRESFAKGYQLRVAEWGVWIADSAGGEGRLRSVLADIPPFVHEVGDSASSIEAALASGGPRRQVRPRPPRVIMPVTKPVIHVTASAPMSVQLAVAFRSGRPWYVFPRPDEFFMPYSDRRLPAEITVLDPAALRPFAVDVRGPCAWMEPTAGLPRGIGLGVRWHSLIVSPTKLPWMVGPAVPADPKYGWWTRLRDVDCSWVSNRGEAERFIYYDGPTLVRSPVECALDERDRLLVRPVKLQSGEQAFTQDAPQVTRDALLVRVKGGRATAERLIVPVDVGSSLRTWPAFPALTPEAEPAAAFERIVIAAGLNASEAAGMVACWRKEFFETDGVRVLMFLTRRDYNFFCPIEVTPRPTELERVGVIWFELR